MGTAPFLDRALVAAGAHLAVTPETLGVALVQITIKLALGPHCREGNDRWMSELTVDMLARLYPRLILTGDEWAVRELGARALRINPNIELDGFETPRCVCIGIGGALLQGRQITGSADGWVASASWANASSFSSQVCNPYAAGVAAVLVVAEVFRAVFTDRLVQAAPMTERRVSLLNFSSTTGAGMPLPACDLGEVAVVGLGAVGNAAVWAWARDETLSGALSLVEPETLELSNLQRYILPTLADVGRAKVDLVSDALAASKLRCTPHRETLAMFADSMAGGFSIPTICVSLDNVVGRRQAQALLPRLVVNGWTGIGGCGASWHLFGSGQQACLACMYLPKGVGPSQTELVAKALGLDPVRAALLWVTGTGVTAEDIQRMAAHLSVDVSVLNSWAGKKLTEVYVEMICGSAALDIIGSGRAEAVPLCHQSVLAGILMAVETLKRTNAELAAQAQVACLATWGDILRPPPRSWAQPHSRAHRCFCSDTDYLATYRLKWGQ